MSWKKFSAGKNEDSVELHTMFLKGGNGEEKSGKRKAGMSQVEEEMKKARLSVPVPLVGDQVGQGISSLSVCSHLGDVNRILPFLSAQERIQFSKTCKEANEVVQTSAAISWAKPDTNKKKNLELRSVAVFTGMEMMGRGGILITRSKLSRILAEAMQCAGGRRLREDEFDFFNTIKGDPMFFGEVVVLPWRDMFNVRRNEVGQIDPYYSYKGAEYAENSPLYGVARYLKVEIDRHDMNRVIISLIETKDKDALIKPEFYLPNGEANLEWERWQSKQYRAISWFTVQEIETIVACIRKSYAAFAAANDD